MEQDAEKQERPVRRIRRLRLQKLMDEFGGPKALAAQTGASETTMIAIVKGRKDVGDELATKLEAKCGKPYGWMDGGLSDQALEIALALDAIADPEQRRIAMALAYSDAHRLGVAPVAAPAELAPIGRPLRDR
jgi:hypothetical protein